MSIINLDMSSERCMRLYRYDVVFAALLFYGEIPHKFKQKRKFN